MTAAKDKDLNDLFLDTLKDIYFAEKHILKALPKMAKAAHSNDLRAAFEKHEMQTEGQVERLEKIFDLIDKPARGKTCDAILGILDEGKEIITEYKGTEALEPGLRHPEGVGHPARHEGGGAAARRDAAGRAQDRRGPDGAGARRGQRGGDGGVSCHTPDRHARVKPGHDELQFSRASCRLQLAQE